MPETTLQELLERNARHVDALPDGYFDAVEDGQKPAAVSVCCSDSRVSQEGMWQVDEPGWLFTPSTIGNQVWDTHEGDLVVDGSVLYPIVNTETRVTAVVGHTGCGAITAALSAVRGDVDAPDGIEKWLALLTPVIEDGLAEDRIDAEDENALINQLVEYNVDRQIQFLLESPDVPEDERIFGFVYDFQGVYGEERGRAYLVNVNGETDVETIRKEVQHEYRECVKRLI